jgi:hypothetical protein
MGVKQSIHLFFTLNGHENLFLKRKSDYRRNIASSLVFVIFVIISLSLLFISALMERIENFVVFVFPLLIVLDFSLRFFLKKNITVMIFPYLTFPIPRWILILYIILSDLQRFWIWGCWLIYSVILWYCNTLTFENAIMLLLFVLQNNYWITVIKTLTGGYALLTYPLCLLFVCTLLLIAGLLNPVFAIIMIVFIVLSMMTGLFFTLKERLYEELNRFAL